MQDFICQHLRAYGPMLVLFDTGRDPGRLDFTLASYMDVERKTMHIKRKTT